VVGTCTRPCVAEKPPCEPRPAACRGPRGEAASCRGKAARGEAAYNLVIVICRQPCALHIFLYTVHHPRWGRSSLYLVRRDTIVFRGEYPPPTGWLHKRYPCRVVDANVGVGADRRRMSGSHSIPFINNGRTRRPLTPIKHVGACQLPVDQAQHARRGNGQPSQSLMTYPPT